MKEIAQEIERFNGPGPCEFAHLERDKIRFSERNQFTIPKVSS